jgi:hypothetical protein
MSPGDSSCGSKLPEEVLKAIENLPAQKVQLQNYEELQGYLLNQKIEEERLRLELLTMKRIEVTLSDDRFELRELEKFRGQEIRILNLESRYHIAKVSQEGDNEEDGNK